MEPVRPFKLTIDHDTIVDLKTRLSATRWPDEQTVDDWSQGIPLSYIREVSDYWLNDYDHQRLARRINKWDNFYTEINDVEIHFMHVQSTNAEARPLLLSHGWPGSVVEFLKVIEPLTEPQNHGGNPSDSFHLIIPSLPGYGFSGRPKVTGWGVEKIADTWAELMRRLGYRSYLAQGGDWGSAITSALARQDVDHCLGIHLNLVFVPPDQSTGDLTEFEKSALESWKFYQDWDSGYSKQQTTRPQTIGYALADSPAGQAAWILEKFYAWTDCKGHPENVLSRDEMLDNVMVYWLNNTGASSARLYWHSFGSVGSDATQIELPMGGSIFPKEIVRTSRRFAETVYRNIVHWNELEEGGHFAALEQPQIFIEEVRSCFRAIK